MKRSLKTLLRVRSTSVKEAQTALVAALVAEQAAMTGEAQLTGAIQAELAAVAALDVGDAAVEAVGRWLPEARIRQRAAEGLRQEAESRTARARAELAAARTAEETVQLLIAADQEQARTDQERRTAAELLERLTGSGGSPPK